MLSDVDSDVINLYGVLNTLVQPDDVPFYGVPFRVLRAQGGRDDRRQALQPPLVDREGVESILDSSIGRVEPGTSDLVETAAVDDGIRITAFLRGGGGTLRIGARRRLVERKLDGEPGEA